MSLISVQFWIFFVFILSVYYFLPGRLQWVWLLLASSAFYASSASWQQSLFFLGFLLCNYAASRLITPDAKRPKTAFRIILAFDLLTLAIFKYSMFFYQIINAATKPFGFGISQEKFDLFHYYCGKVYPLHISYFLLIVVGYLADVYWGKSEVQKNPGKMLLFSGFFLQMISGPIVQYDQMQGQLWGEKHRFDYETVVRGIERVLWGVFKKLMIAERAAVMVDTIYSYYEAYTGFYVPFAAALFALQLYADFSGLMDIVLGLAQCLGISLPENFNTPFYSTDLSEFWRRWHMTLGAFLRDYVLYPLERSTPWRKLRKFCKKRFGKGYENKFNLPLYLALLISWFLIGLWHGGGWNYIFGVGLYMFLVIVLGETLRPIFVKATALLRIDTECFSWQLFRRIRTFLLFIFGLSFFRAETLQDGFLMWKGAFAKFNPWIFFDRSLYELGLSGRQCFILFLGLLVLLFVSMLSQRGSVRELLHKQNFVFRLSLLLLLFATTVSFGYYGTEFVAADFIYGRF